MNGELCCHFQSDQCLTSLSLFTFMHWRKKWQPTPVFLPGESQGRGSLVGCVYGVTQSRTRLKWLSSSSRKRREGNSEEERNLFVWNEWSYFYYSFSNWRWRSFFLFTHHFQRKWRTGRGIHQSLCSKKKCHNPITLSILTPTGRKRYPSYSLYYLSLCPHPILLHFFIVIKYT